MVSASQWVTLCRSRSLELAGFSADSAALAWSAGFAIGRCWRWLPPLVVVTTEAVLAVTVLVVALVLVRLTV